MNSLLFRETETVEVAPRHLLAIDNVQELSAAFAEHVRAGGAYVAYCHSTGYAGAYGGVLSVCKGTDRSGLCWEPIQVQPVLESASRIPARRQLVLPLPAGWEARREVLDQLAALLLRVAEGECWDELLSFLRRHELTEALRALDDVSVSAVCSHFRPGAAAIVCPHCGTDLTAWLQGAIAP
jgi:hypothetical protein